MWTKSPFAPFDKGGWGDFEREPFHIAEIFANKHRLVKRILGRRDSLTLRAKSPYKIIQEGAF
jgi:hypothetical protein